MIRTPLALAVAIALGALALPDPAAGAAAVCNTYCDGRDPAKAAGARLALTLAHSGRHITLQFADGDDMGWASIEGGKPGDELWLDRSFDAGRSWDDGSRLGDTQIPAGADAWRTYMFNVDDPAHFRVGALRACGRATGSAQIACTAWARSTRDAADRRAAAATGLMAFYDYNTGLFATTGWWNSANALTAIIDNARLTGTISYRYAIGRTYDTNRTAQGGDFTNEYMDDTAWWAMAWIAAYDLTGDKRYLDTARTDAEHIHKYWDGVCGGGVWWRTSKTTKNAIANSLYIQLNAALHRRLTGDTTYLARATAGLAWFKKVGMVNASQLVNDGIKMSTCKNSGQPVWTYNQGTLIAALVELYRATDDAAHLAAARKLGDAATTHSSLNSSGIMRELCEPTASCADSGPSFKGVLARALGTLNSALADHPYAAYLTKQAAKAYGADRTTLDLYGLRWAGPFDYADAARQQSALDLLNAAN